MTATYHLPTAHKSETAERLGELLHGKDHVTKSEFVAYIAQTLQRERQAHGKTAKQLVDMQAVLGCIRQRVERFKEAIEPAMSKTAPQGRVREFLGDLERMLGEP